MNAGSALSRDELVRRYVVLHLKLLELFHVTALSHHLQDHQAQSPQVLGYSVDRVRETLLGSIAIAFTAICDQSSPTNARQILSQLHPQHAKAIRRIWRSKINAGEKIMRRFRHKAGAHGDDLDEYLVAKRGIYSDREVVVRSLDSFFRLVILLLKRRERELPNFDDEIRRVLLHAELKLPPGEGFSRRWLRAVQLIDSTSSSIRF